MPFRALCAQLCALMLLVTTTAATPLVVLADQSGVAVTAADGVQQDVARVLDEGMMLESRGQWSDALVLYQNALRNRPGDPQLAQRRSLARLNHDLERRQADRSFLRQVGATNPEASRAIYAEILLKVQSYYVDEPDWNEIARFGLTSLKLALKSPRFRELYLTGVEGERIDAAFAALTAELNRFIVRQRTDAVWVAGHSAEHLSRSLGLPAQATVFEFICGAVSALDPYSAFMSDNQYGETMSQIEGNFVGLGVELRTEPESLLILNVIAAGPAGQAGLQVNDRIIAVDGRTVASLGTEIAADLLRGVEGSTVSLDVRRGEQTATVSMVRRRVEIPSVEGAAILDPAAGVGYIRITSFQKTTPADFDAALWSLQKQGMRSLVMDLRGNPGGLLTAAVEIADRFIAQGVLVSTRGRNPLEDFTHRAQPAGTWNLPLVVLIDGDSASASEILAAAIHDHQRGKIVGEKSYGKGSVQGIFPLNVAGGGIRLTTAKFYSPQGHVINQVGVTPDLLVHRAAKPAFEDEPATTTASDNVLDAAVALARSDKPMPNIVNGTMTGSLATGSTVAGR